MPKNRGPAWLYPERSRCFTCRSYFGFIVVENIYCSEKCAGLPPDRFPELVRRVPLPVGINTKSLPRSCQSGYRRKWKPKARFITQEDAELVETRESGYQYVALPGNRMGLYHYDGPPRRPDPYARVYACLHCGYYHIGHHYQLPPGVPQPERVKAPYPARAPQLAKELKA